MSEDQPLPEHAEVEETPGGKLVFIEESPGVKFLIGFYEVEDFEEIRIALIKRGLDPTAIYNRTLYPVFTDSEE